MPADGSLKEAKAQRRDYLIIYVLCAVLLVALGLLWLRQQGWFRAGPVVEHTPEKLLEKPIDLNRARWFELTQIHGIGEKRAREIIGLRERKRREQRKRREKEVGFKRVEELAEVRGITSEIIERMREKVRVGPPAQDKERKP